MSLFFFSLEMHGKTIQKWLKALGYEENSSALYTRPGQAASAHSYSREIDALLNKEGDVRASAVFEVDHVPAVCIVEGSKNAEAGWLPAVRQKIWNQSLVSLLLVIDGDTLTPYPAQREVDVTRLVSLKLSDAVETGPFSARDIQSGDVQKRHADWFTLESRVDRELLNNLKYSVLQLIKHGIDRDSAQFLLGQCLFVSYLEHREIVSEVYRTRRGVGQLQELIASRDAAGLGKLFKCLKRDFNGDFLDPENAPHAGWKDLPDEAYDLLDQFLRRVNIETGQSSFWNYDFRYIPVELISGIYETFLGDDQEALGAYYTPRHLANLAVDQAFTASIDVTQEVVFDGACGSGILLTTAFRRMICAAEYRTGGELTFSARSELLLRSIRGGDISKAACRVTVFSLYLSLMEDLQPSDILLLQEDEQVKLPPLIGKTILCGDDVGDFFSAKQRFANSQSCTIFLSNPPWFEPSAGQAGLPYEAWAEANKRFLPHRQIAAAFAHKGLETITDAGRICLILPVKLFTAPTSQRFLREWLVYCAIDRIINFSDIRRLLFAGAVHPCVIVTAQRRSEVTRGRIPYYERIEYWVPKADVSISFGRLTVHSADRQHLFAQDVWKDNQALRTHLWGGNNDAALIGRLALTGTLADLTKGKEPRWKIVKGFNQTRHSSPPLDVKPLKKLRFLNTRDIPRDAPVLDSQLLRPFPDEITSVVSYGSNGGAAFTGPRVLFPDGASSDFEPNAVFAHESFCFKHSVAAICGPEKDEDALRFLTMYLRSNLTRYLLLHTAYSLVAERPRITLGEVDKLPFVLPQSHTDPDRAEQIIKDVANITRQWEQSDLFAQIANAPQFRAVAEKLIFEYFGLDDRETLLVRDACDYMIPSVQPNRYESIRTAYRDLPTEHDLTEHSAWLAEELQRWRKLLGGSGSITVETIAYRPEAIGALGIVRISLAEKDSKAKVTINDEMAFNLINTLKSNRLVPMEIWSNFYLAADFLIQAGDQMYLIKPLVKRLWLRSQALTDAQRIVDAIRYPEAA
jgi:hypothetical protein